MCADFRIITITSSLLNDSTEDKKIYEIKTEFGKTIKASGEHRFLIEGRWKQVRDIEFGDKIKTTDFKLDKKKYITTGTGSGAHNHDGSLYTLEEKEQIKKLKIKYKNKCQDCKSERNIEMHHMDGNHRNNSDDNTRLLCKRCHHSNKYHKRKIYKRFKNGYSTCDEIIISITYIGIDDTYDIEMIGEPRNFIANGFISHNSYGFNLSHAVEYSVISYWDMWCKVYYPAEFLCASLTYGAELKREDLVMEAIRLGLDVRPPKIGVSKSHNWIIRKNILYCPFVEIKGFGDKTAKYAEAEQTKGFFTGKKTELPERFKKILSEVDASNDVKVNSEFADKIEKYFKFSFNPDPYKKYDNMIKVLSRSVRFDVLKSVDFGATWTDASSGFGAVPCAIGTGASSRASGADPGVRGRGARTAEAAHARAHPRFETRCHTRRWSYFSGRRTGSRKYCPQGVSPEPRNVAEKRVQDSVSSRADG